MRDFGEVSALTDHNRSGWLDLLTELIYAPKQLFNKDDLGHTPGY